MLGVFSNSRTVWLRRLVLCGLMPAFTVAAQNNAPTPPGACPALLIKTFNRLQDDAPQDLCQYSGKVLLVVNTASYCSFTYQYEGLEKLQSVYKARGLVVLGFPSNDFGQLEPGSNRQIADFCANTYGIKFPMFNKSAVVGSNANPLYRELVQASGKSPQWNFHKYLIDRKGRITGSYPSSLAPQDKRLLSDIEQALGGN